jgi:hypothetical protein
LDKDKRKIRFARKNSKVDRLILSFALLFYLQHNHACSGIQCQNYTHFQNYATSLKKKYSYFKCQFYVTKTARNSKRTMAEKGHDCKHSPFFLPLHSSFFPHQNYTHRFFLQNYTRRFFRDDAIITRDVFLRGRLIRIQINEYLLNANQLC